MVTPNPRPTSPVVDPICFVDIETTGLDPRRHAIWEVGVVRVDAAGRSEFEWQVEIPPGAEADPEALKVGGYYERRRDPVHDPYRVANELWVLLEGAYLAGAAPSFDAAFLGHFLRAHDRPPQPWKHRLLCVETYAAGACGWPVPVSLSETCERLGVERRDAHTALADARTAEAVYCEILDPHRE